jgi:hypothetical protein
MAGWIDTIRNVAPAIGHALGSLGVPGGAALEAVSKALLGRPDATEAEVAARVANWTPADELAMKAAEEKFTIDLIDKAVALEQVDASDRANARGREVSTHDVTTRILAFSIVAMVAAQMVLLTQHAIPNENRDAANQLIGVLYLALGNVLGYYFGSSVGSRMKDVAAMRGAAK